MTPAAERPSARLARLAEFRWRSVIRIFAVVMAVLGLILIANEIWENITSCSAGTCSRIHLSTMLWGVTLMALGLLILQKGDVSLSIKEIADTGTIVRSWWGQGRRSDDKKGTTVVIEERTTVVTPAPSVPPQNPVPPRAPARPQSERGEE